MTHPPFHSSSHPTHPPIHPPKNPRIFWIQALLLFIIGFLVSLWLLRQYAARHNEPSTQAGTQVAIQALDSPSLKLPPQYQALETSGLGGRKRFTKTSIKGATVLLDLRHNTPDIADFDQFKEIILNQFSATTSAPRLDTWTMGPSTINLVYIEGTKDENSPLAIYGAYSKNTDLILIGTPETIAAERISFLSILHELL